MARGAPGRGPPDLTHVWSSLSGRSRGLPFAVRTIQAMTTQVARRAGLDPAKVSLHEIGTILGHENPATTATYGRVKARQLEQATSPCRGHPLHQAASCQA